MAADTQDERAAALYRLCIAM